VPLLGGLTGFIDKYLLGYALGTAAGPALEPYAQNLANAGWEDHQVRPLDAFIMAQIAVENPSYDGTARTWAARAGVDGGRFDALKELADEPPAFATLLTLWRRNFISPGAFNLGLRHLRIESDYHDGLRLLKDSPLSPAEVANAIQQGFIPGDGILPADPGGTRDITPPTEVVAIDPQDEAAASGTPPARLQVLAQLAGLPPGPMELLQMWNRGIITETAVEHGIREGHTKTKWTSALKELRHFLISPQEAAGLRLRGWLTKAEAERHGALRGADAETMELLYLNRGRPATTRQVHIGYARGGALPGAAGEREAFAKAVAQSNIRTEYTDLLWAQRHTYPSAFVVRALAQAGTFNRDETHDILIESGWPERYADLAADAWAGAGAAGPSTKWADRARTRLFTTAQSEFLAFSLGEPQARSLLGELGATEAEQDVTIRLWTAAREVIETELSPTVIRAAYARAALSLDDARARLAAAGYSPANADIFLGLAPPELTPAEIRREYSRAVITLDEAVAALVAQGFEDANARAYLAEARPELSARDIKDAFQSQVIDETTARVRLAALGYPEEDIDILIATWTPPPATP